MIVAGFGFRSGVSLSSLRGAFVLAQKGQPPVTHLATAHDKVAALAPLAEVLGLPAMGIALDILAATPTLTCSLASVNVRNVGSVAEGSAIAAAGTNALLLGPRHISVDRMATCAIAQGTPT